MQSKYERELVDAERQILQRRLSFANQEAHALQHSVRNGVGCSLWISIPICILGYLVAENKPPLWFPAIIILLIALGFLATWSFEKKRKLPKLKKSILDLESALQDGVAQVWNIQPTAFIELDEIEDEGEFFFLQIEARKVILLGGQDFYEAKRFPTTDFDLIDICDSNGNQLAFRIEQRGTPLLPLKVIGQDDPIREFIPYDYIELDCSLEELESCLKKIPRGIP